MNDRAIWMLAVLTSVAGGGCRLAERHLGVPSKDMSTAVTDLASDMTMLDMARTSGGADLASPDMAQHSTVGRVVLFGGVTFPNNTLTEMNDTWQYDGTKWTNTIPTGDPTSPSPRDGFVMVFDSGRGKVVLFGRKVSTKGSDLRDETWEFDGTKWKQVKIAGPPARNEAIAVYDSARGRTVMFGGCGLSICPSNDTWEYDGAQWINTVANGDANSPSPRTSARAAYDATRQKVVLFGGLNGSADASNDTWEYAAGRWTNTLAAGAAGNPTAVASAAMVYDASRAKSVIFGGLGNSGWTQGTYEYGGSSWQPKNIADPSIRDASAATFDNARSVMVVFGGRNVGKFVNDTWEYDGAKWTNTIADGDANSPMARMSGAAVFARW